MSLLTIIRSVCGRLALPQPAVVATSTDRQVQQLFALLNEEGIDLAESYPWQIMREEFLFETIAQPDQTGLIPIDYDRWVPNSFFNRSTRRPMTGPITPREWQWIQAQPVYSTVYLAFIERTGNFMIAPTPPAGQEIAGEYVSKNWCQSNPAPPGASVLQPAFVADTDTALLDEELMTLGLRWRWLKAKGLDYGEEMATYERRKETRQARDGGSTAISLAPQPADPSRANLPDGNFGI